MKKLSHSKIRQLKSLGAENIEKESAGFYTFTSKERIPTETLRKMFFTATFRTSSKKDDSGEISYFYTIIL